MKFRAQLIELYNRITDYSEKLEVHLNGLNNLYPYEIESVVANSPTASRSANMLSKFIAGKGVTEDVTLDRSKNYRLSDFVKAVANDIAVQYGCFIHISYKIEEGQIVPKMPKVLDYRHCRIAKRDDSDFQGKIYVKDWKDRSLRSKKAKWYYPFNNNQDVLLAQIFNDAKLQGVGELTLENSIPHFRGQVYYLNLTPQLDYALSLFDSVYNDCDTEYRISLYSNNVLRTGFLGKIAVVTQGLDEQQSEQIDNDVKEWLGSENSGSVYRLDLEQTIDIDKAFKILTIPSQFDEAQFKETKDAVRLNILGACNNIPEALVYKSGGLFSSSGEAYKQMKIFYNEQTEYERKKIEELLQMFGYFTSIIPLIDETTGI